MLRAAWLLHKGGLLCHIVRGGARMMEARGIPIPIDERGSKVTDERTLLVLGEGGDTWLELTDELVAKQV